MIKNPPSHRNNSQTNRKFDLNKRWSAVERSSFVRARRSRDLWTKWENIQGACDDGGSISHPVTTRNLWQNIVYVIHIGWRKYIHVASKSNGDGKHILHPLQSGFIKRCAPRKNPDISNIYIYGVMIRVQYILRAIKRQNKARINVF